jgi:cytochrome bd-type quinol oxidase subunit 2
MKIQTIRQGIITLIATLGMALPLLMVAAPVNAQLTDEIRGGARATDPSTNPDEAGVKVDDTVRTVINAFSWVVGIISVIMIIVGGVKYITSSGDSSNVTSAKNTILYAVIGLVVVAMAQFVVLFVLSQLE